MWLEFGEASSLERYWPSDGNQAGTSGHLLNSSWRYNCVTFVFLSVYASCAYLTSKTSLQIGCRFLLGSQLVSRVGCDFKMPFLLRSLSPIRLQIGPADAVKSTPPPRPPPYQCLLNQPVQFPASVPFTDQVIWRRSVIQHPAWAPLFTYLSHSRSGKTKKDEINVRKESRLEFYKQDGQKQQRVFRLIPSKALLSACHLSLFVRGFFFFIPSLLTFNSGSSAPRNPPTPPPPSHARRLGGK